MVTFIVNLKIEQHMENFHSLWSKNRLLLSQYWRKAEHYFMRLLLLSKNKILWPSPLKEEVESPWDYLGLVGKNTLVVRGTSISRTRTL